MPALLHLHSDQVTTEGGPLLRLCQMAHGSGEGRCVGYSRTVLYDSHSLSECIHPAEQLGGEGVGHLLQYVFQICHLAAMVSWQW